MHVLVTGSRGFVGRRLVRRLEAMGWPVTPVERVSREIESPGAPVGYALDSADMRDALTSPDLRVVHLGWDIGRRNDWVAQANCVAGSASLLSQLLPFKPRQLICLGSAEEYGRREGVLSEHDAPSLPLTAYGWAKATMRELLVSWREPGTAVLWLRPFLVYGPDQSGHMVVPTAVRAAMERRPAQFTDGRQLRDFVHVEDVVDAIVMGLERVPDGMNVINLGTGEPVAVRDFLEQVELLFSASGLFAMGAIARRPGEPDIVVADVGRAAAVIGWRASIRWREGVASLRH